MAGCPVHDRRLSWAERNAPRLLTALAFVAIAALASVLRFDALGLRTFSDDESVYSLVARQVGRGGGYQAVPELSPLHMLATAGVFRAFGNSDVTARIVPAIAGLALALLPFLFARDLGRPAATSASLMLAVSPSLMYYSRYAGPDVELVLLTAALVMFVWRYLSTENRAYLYAIALVLALAVAASVTALAVVPVVLAYLAHRTGAAFAVQSREGRPGERVRTHYDALRLSPGASTRDVRAAYRQALEVSKPRERESLADAYRLLSSPRRRESYDRRLARERQAAKEAAHEPGMVRIGCAYALGWLVALLWPFAGRARRVLRLSARPAAADPLVVILMLAAPFYGPLAEKLPGVGDRGFAGQTPTLVLGGSLLRPGGETPVMLTTLGIIFGASLALGFAWRWHVWVICSAAFYATVIALFTAGFQDRGGLWTGVWGTLDYTWRPEAVHPDAPLYAQARLLAQFEFVPLAVLAASVLVAVARGAMRDRTFILATSSALAIAAAVPGSLPGAGVMRAPLAGALICAGVLSLRMPPLTKLLAFWAAGAFVMFSLIGRKEPSLAVHIAVPAAFLAAKLLGDAVTAFELPVAAVPSFRLSAPRRLAQGVLAAGVAAASVFALRAGALTAFGRGELPQLASSLATRDRGDAPASRIATAQNAADVRELSRAIAEAAATSGAEIAQPIALDTSYGFGRGWGWYLRDYTALTLADMRKPYTPPDGAIIIVDARNRANVAVSPGMLAVTFTKRWIPGSVGGLTPRDAAAALVDGATWDSWLATVRGDEPQARFDYTEGVAYFPAWLSASVELPRQSDVLSISVSPESGR